MAPVPEKPGDFIDFNAAELRTTFDDDGNALLTIASGNVVARYQDMAISSDRAHADHKTDIAVFEGNVVFQVGVQKVRGERVTINMAAGQWAFESATAVITPQFMQGYIVAPLYSRNALFEGDRDREVTGIDSEITSCDLAKPHYDLVARRVEVYPRNKIVLRDVGAYALGRKVMTLPRVVVPIRGINKDPAIVPRLNQTAEEGLALKTSYAYVGSRSQSGSLLLDLMSRKGIGTGLHHNYKLSNSTGELYAYYIHDQNINKDTFTGTFKHDQKLGTLKASLSSDFRSNSYRYAPDSNTMNSRFSLTRDRTGANSSLVVVQSVNNTFTRTSRLTGDLKHTQLFGEATQLDSEFDYTEFTSDQTRARLQSNLMFTKKEDRFDWSINAQKLTDLSDETFVGGGRFAGIERLPELALVTDSARLGDFLPLGLPLKMKLSYGRFAELPANTELDRTYVDINTPLKRYALSHSWTFGAGAGFKQFLYSDDTARYSYDAGAELSKRLGNKSKFALTYRLQQPRGFTPFRFDYVGNYNIANASLTLDESEKLRLSVLGGYNFQQKNFPWQDITFRCSWRPAPSFLLYTATGYDINRSTWRTLINQVRVRSGDRFKLDIGTRYDTTTERLATIKTQLDAPLGNKMRLQALAGYNGRTDSFDYRSVRLTRDLHCWEASITYVDQSGFYTDRGIYINFRIKAFPLVENFGMGSFGQALDTSVGQVY
ncbi:MAG: hypothetical protein A2Z18_09385 [Armatimonadetes bacterium RBG_16_58_9]|nr:MAG: hypothetical protein A2Z18_09385 [Armatimonadetes bacterium RBG_16_58_9]